VIPDSTVRRAKSPDEILKNLAGIYISYSGKMGADLMIHGYGTREISILVDGIPVTLPYDGTFDISQLPVSDLAAIKIYKGVGADLFGPNAMGGAVNFVTLSPFSGVKNVSLGIGRNFDKFASFNYSFVRGKLGVLLSGGYAKSDGYYLSKKFESTEVEDGGVRENSQYEKKHMRIKAGYTTSSFGNFYFSAGIIDNSRGVPPKIIGRPRYWRFPVWQEKLIKISHELLKDNLLLRSNVYYDGFYNVLRAYRDPQYTTLKWESTYDDHSLGANFYADSKNFSFSAGIKKDVHRDKRDVNAPWEKVEGLSGSAGVNAQSILLSHTVAAGVSAHFLKTQANESRTIFTLNPSFGVVGTLKDFRWSFSAAVRSRFPTLKELYSSRMGRYYPNPSLKPEKSLNLNFGLSGNFAGFSTSLNFFDSELKDLIDRVKVDSLYQMQNINRARYYGIEMNTGNKFVTVGYTYLKALNLSPNRKFDRLEYRPEHKLNLRVTPPAILNFKLSGSVEYVGKRYYIDRDSLKALSPYTLVNVSISRSMGRVSAELQLNNIFDVNYESEEGYPMPGRYYRFTISLGLD